MATCGARSAGFRGLAAGFVLILSGCETNHGQPTPIERQTLDSALETGVPPVPAVTVSGRVFEYTADERRPLAGLRLRVTGDGDRVFPDIVSGADGTYEVSGIPADAHISVSPAPGAEHRVLCAPRVFSALMWRPGLALWTTDVHTVHDNWLDDRWPSLMPMPGTTVMGTVFERVGEAVRPVAGATVQRTDGAGSAGPVSATTAATGFYLLCSTLGSDMAAYVSVLKEGYHSASRPFLQGWDYTVDVELVRVAP